MTMHGPERSGTTPPDDALRRTTPKDTPTDTPMDTPGDRTVHDAVGAYALGVLDAAEMTAFEEHLVDCEQCARHLDELVGMGPLLADLAGLPDAPDPVPGTPRPVPPARDIAAEITARPGTRLADRLLAEVATHRARRRRRVRYLVAAAAALVIAGPVGTLALDPGGDQQTVQPSGYKASLQRMPIKVRGADATTKVKALIGMNETPWGTDTILELRNVKGPLSCSLALVGKDGRRETMATWTVPTPGYGLVGSPDKEAREPLYIWTATAVPLADIDYFEVRTSEGRNLVKVDAQHGS